MDRIKKCPFCGGEAEINLLLGNYCVTCTECAGAIFPCVGMTEKEAIKAWNTRKPVEQVMRRLERNFCPDWNRKWVSAMLRAIEILKEEMG